MFPPFFSRGYDLGKKRALRNDVVLPVLFLSTLCGAAVWSLLLGTSHLAPDGFHPREPASGRPRTHSREVHHRRRVVGDVFWHQAPAAVAGLADSRDGAALDARWCAPDPRRTSVGPPHCRHPTLASFYGLSIAGRSEGVHFHRDKWVGCIVAGTLLGTISELYDK